MSDRSTDTKDTQPVATQNGEINPSRRKLAGAALGAGAIFTLASRPVLAGVCNSPSAAASGNMSHHGPAPNCTGRSPAQWVASVNSNQTNNGFPGTNVVFNSVFANGNGIIWPNGANGRLRQVMDSTANPDNVNATPRPNPISAEFAATLLSIRGGRIPTAVLTEVALIGMWNDWRTTGTFQPKAGVNWDANQIVTYLRTLQDA